MWLLLSVAVDVAVALALAVDVAAAVALAVAVPVPGNGMAGDEVSGFGIAGVPGVRTTATFLALLPVASLLLASPPVDSLADLGGVQVL